MFKQNKMSEYRYNKVISDTNELIYKIETDS